MEANKAVGYQKKQGKEPSGKAAISMSILPYIYWIISVVLLMAGIEINVGIGFFIGLILTTVMIYCFIEVFRGLIKGKKRDCLLLH